MTGKKVSYIRGGNKVSQKHADAADLYQDISDTADKDSVKQVNNLDQRLGVWSKTDDGKIVITYPDGRQEYLKD
ncbi:MAG: hypothetical protein KTR16_13290 [Acidiferrobacterales bacterium]|nr:hypothetical protein [Acidiferrobacterales bacterium]